MEHPVSRTAPEKVAEVVIAYYRLVEQLPGAAQDLADWVATLSPAERLDATGLNWTQATRLPTFKRYRLERHGYSMAAYMKNHLTRTELGYWVDDNDGGGRAV